MHKIHKVIITGIKNHGSSLNKKLSLSICIKGSNCEVLISVKLQNDYACYFDIIKDKDHIWKIIAFLILVINWFNPLSWVSFILFSRDMELACDEKVIKNLGEVEKKAYAESLLSCSFKKKIAIVYPLAFGEVGVKQRVKSILSYKKSSFAALFLSFLVFIVIGICFLTNPPQEYQVNVMISTDVNPTQIQIHKREIELEQILLDYNKDGIIEVSVSLQDLNDVVESANILVVGQEKIMDIDEQDKIMNLVSEYLNLDTHDINLEYRGG